MRYKITIEYDGTNYLGWADSISTAIENAIFKLTKEKIKVWGAGRTDKGVHALGQVAHFDLTDEYNVAKFTASINYFLKQNKDDIVILKTEEVDSEFDARYSAIARYYVYKILNREQDSIIDKNRVWHIYRELDLDEMQKCLPLLVGRKDWNSFVGTGNQAKSTIKTINKVTLTKDKNYIIFKIEAKSFLYHQVRNIVGTLVEVGLGKRSVKDFEKIIEAKDRTKAGKTAFAGGLYLEKIDY